MAKRWLFNNNKIRLSNFYALSIKFARLYKRLVLAIISLLLFGILNQTHLKKPNCLIIEYQTIGLINLNYFKITTAQNAQIRLHHARYFGQILSQYQS